MSIYNKTKKFLFKIDPENTHKIAEYFLQGVSNLSIFQEIFIKNFYFYDEILENEIFGLKFYNPIGLAAGFDKNALMIRGLSTLGFGFIEIGTVTKKPQGGNPKPRLFRHIIEESLQNAMGFNNDGGFRVSQRLKKIYPFVLPIGINLGKNKIIPQEDALQNYQSVLEDFLDVGDYYVFNLSSPNTPNLRDLQNISFVDELFCMAKSKTNKPVFLKISPDMNTDSMLEVCQKAIEKGCDGIIATNTSIDYSLVSSPKKIGGISGKALKEKSLEVFKELSRAFFDKTILISVGGIDSSLEAYNRIKLGASLVQVYSSLIFYGPYLCKDFNSDIAEFLRKDGFMSIKDAIGVDRK